MLLFDLFCEEYKYKVLKLNRTTETCMKKSKRNAYIYIVLIITIFILWRILGNETIFMGLSLLGLSLIIFILNSKEKKTWKKELASRKQIALKYYSSLYNVIVSFCNSSQLTEEQLNTFIAACKNELSSTFADSGIGGMMIEATKVFVIPIITFVIGLYADQLKTIPVSTIIEDVAYIILIIFAGVIVCHAIKSAYNIVGNKAIKKGLLDDLNNLKIYLCINERVRENNS